ncbi:MAG: serine hydrolase, partial [Pannonibacter indicus]
MTASVSHSTAALRVLRAGLAGLAILALAACQSAQQASRPPAMAAVAAVPAVQATAAPAPLAVSLAPAKAEVRGKSVLVVDMATGQELDSFNADAPRYPASLTKMMTLYLLFEAIDRGEISLDSQLAVSARAASRPPAKLGVAAGTSLRVEDAVQALAIRSANDMAVAVAEQLAGSEDAFAAEMTRKALQLGMSRTRFVNASGLPDAPQVSPARDMATLGQAQRRYSYASWTGPSHHAFAMGMLPHILQRWMGLQRRFLGKQAEASDHAGSKGAAAKVLQYVLSSGLLGLSAWLLLEGGLPGG